MEAVKASLEKLSNDEVRVRVIHGGVGAINESDVMLASTSQAIIVGFNVRPDNAARDSAARANVDMRMYRVIYDAINEIEAAMKGMLAPKFREVLLGHAEVRQTYKVSGVGTVAGCYVRTASSSGRTARSGWSGTASSSTRAFWPPCSGSRTPAKEVLAGYECGLTIEKFNDIKEGDIIEAFTMEEIPPVNGESSSYNARLRSPSGAARLRPRSCVQGFCGAKPCFGGIHFRQRMGGPHETPVSWGRRYGGSLHHGGDSPVNGESGPWRDGAFLASTGLSTDSSQMAVGSRDTTQEPPPDAL